MKLDKEQLSNINKTRGQILEVLAYEKGLYSVKMAGKRLKERGIKLREANIRYHLKGLTEINLVDRIAATKATKRAKESDPGARYFYKIDPRYIGFYFIYLPKEGEYIEKKIPLGRHDLLVILDYNVLNNDGDAIITEFFMFENTGDDPIESGRHSLGSDKAFSTFDEIELEVFDGNGNKLKFEPIRMTERYEMAFRVYFKPIKKGEVYSYWYKRKKNRAFPITNQNNEVFPLIRIQNTFSKTIRPPTELLVISITLQEEIKGIKKMRGVFKIEGIPEKLETTKIKPFSYLENNRVKILWYISEPIFDIIYTLELEPKV